MRRCVLLLVLASGCVPPPPESDAGPPLTLEPALLVADGAESPDSTDAPELLPLTVPDDLAALLTELPPVLLAMPSGRSHDVFLDLPAGTEAVVLIARAHDGVHALLERAVAPDGEVLVTDREPADLSERERAVARGFSAQFFSPNRVVPGRETAAFLIPNTPDVGFSSGRYRLRLSSALVSRDEAGQVSRAPATRPLWLSALVKRKAEATSLLGSLDLTLHLTGAAGLTSENARDNEGLQASLAVVREALLGIGLRLGEVAYVDVAAGFSTLVLGEGCEGGDLDELMSKSSEGPEGIHLFLVERFRCELEGGVDVGGGIGGMTAGLPGPPWLRGSPRSGVAIATAPFAGDPGKLGLVLAHELGHFLGLYHTQENNFFGGPAVYDNISDTPDDEGARDNLMYFLAEDTTALSDGQASVLRASPWVRP